MDLGLLGEMREYSTSSITRGSGGGGGRGEGGGGVRRSAGGGGREVEKDRSTPET